MSAPVKVFHGKIQDGQVILAEPGAWEKLVARLEGKEIDIRLSRRRYTRSLNANSYYWGVVISILAEYCGYDPEEMHQALKWKFLKVHGEFETVRSTTELDSAQFGEYVDNCRRLAAELGVVIPNPGEAE